MNGTLDQSNEGFTYIQHDTDSYLGQEFVPSMSTLMEVEVYIVTMNPGYGDATITMNVRETFADYGYPNNLGPILATTPQLVTDGGAEVSIGSTITFESSFNLCI